MNSDLFRDTAFGQIARLLTHGKAFPYREERPDFQLPESYINIQNEPPAPDAPELEAHPENAIGENAVSKKLDEKETNLGHHSDDRLSTEGTLKEEDTPAATLPNTSANSEHNLPREENLDLEKAETKPDLEKTASQPIAPTKTKEGIILVDWYTTDDPENPKNWVNLKRGIVVLQIYLYTLSVYLGSSIYTPSEPDVMRIFGVSATVAQLGLALYVLGYGTGPLLFSPMSEIPSIGRNPPYVVTFGIFVILCVPAALVNNVPGLLVLRFLQGFFGSPCLATGGASMADVTSLIKLSWFITGWAGFATGGPALGPLISGFSVPAENWHWSLWEMLWLAGPIFLSMFFLLPETNGATILLRRAERIRKITGNPNYKSQSEIDQSKLTFKEIAFETLVRPWQINFLDPAVLFSTVYVMIIYGIYYMFFEVFPIVYEQRYGMSLGEMGLVFLVIFVGVGIAIPVYFCYLKFVFEKEVLVRGLSEPERLLHPALVTSILPPIGLFMFGWTGREETGAPWIVPTIAILIFTVGVFILIQSLFIYIPMIYPKYAASMFAFNDFARSAFAAGAILYADALFKNLGVGRGCTLLGGLNVGCVFGVWALYIYGARLRARSRFTAKF